jgi:hypothetical protein
MLTHEPELLLEELVLPLAELVLPPDDELLEDVLAPPLPVELVDDVEVPPAPPAPWSGPLEHAPTSAMAVPMDSAREDSKKI